jgi:hypothetical protein
VAPPESISYLAVTSFIQPRSGSYSSPTVISSVARLQCVPWR